MYSREYICYGGPDCQHQEFVKETLVDFGHDAYSYSVYSHLFSQIMLYYNNGKTKEQRKSRYMCSRYYFEIVRSGQRSRAFGLATTTVQLIVRGGYLQNIHKVINI